MYGNVGLQLKNGNSQQRCEAPKRVTVFVYSSFFSRRARRKPPLGIHFACSFNRVFDVSVRHQSFQHERETRGHESSSVHGEKEEEHELKGISLGVES